MSTLTCTECGFDGSRWSDDDLERTLAHTDDLIGYVLDGADAAFVAEAVATPIALDDDPVVSAHALMHRVHELAATRRAGHPFEPMVGRVDSLQASGGGVPKTSVPVAEIGTGGLVGDVQHTRLHHGRPWQEVCLYSADVIAALRREGHPITPGGVGENVTISGIDWSRLRGGLTIAIAGRSGDVGNVRLRTTSPATPCHKIADCFTDRHWNRIHHGEQPGWARWYASVLTGGTIAPGDTVTITA